MILAVPETLSNQLSAEAKPFSHELTPIGARDQERSLHFCIFLFFLPFSVLDSCSLVLFAAKKRVWLNAKLFVNHEHPRNEGLLFLIRVHWFLFVAEKRVWLNAEY